jgi:hypothetical protein
MSTHTSTSQGHTRTIAWLLACILPVLYLLSIAPVTVLSRAAWVEHYRAPYKWAYANTAHDGFGEVLHRYEAWWQHTLTGFAYPYEFDPPSIPQSPPSARPRSR